MGIVRFALRFPHTFYVLTALILFLGVAAIRTMPTDIFPEIRIPVVTVIWSYTALSTPEMEQRVSTYSQYSISANVNGIKNIEAQTLSGLSVQKIYFQQDVNLDLAIAQIVSATNAIRALMPPGIQPPVVVQFNASSVPVLQISLSSDTLNEQQLYDYGIYRMRQQLTPIPGITLPTPAGGKYRQIMVDIDPAKLVAKGLTPLDVVNAVNAQNLTLPSGTAKMGDTQYVVRTNATPSTIDDLNNIPIKVANGATIFVKDVGQVHDGWLVQQNVVREDGRRSVLLSIIKNGNASTLDVVSRVRDALKTARAAAPPGLEIKELFDQSVFVKQSIAGVLREGAIAAGLTALMILLFLGSWRSTVVVMISIPLAILASLVVLYFLGETLNTMTLGGLALAVGILVDDSTVTIENTHRLLTEERMPLPAATLHGSAGIAVPTLVSTLAISCVFTSVVFLEGPAKYLFTPLGLAVVFAMLASYGLSRTLTPITIGLLLRGEHHGPASGAARSSFARLHGAFERGFEHMRDGYVRLLTTLLNRRFIVPVIAVMVLALGVAMLVLVGRDFFPLIDGGQIQLHVRARAGTRIETTERIFQSIEDKIREVVPESERSLIVDNIGHVAAQQAQLQVLNQQKLYQRVVAPFDGVITQRNVDVGTLVQADATSSTFMFTIMQSNVIRTQVFVPQDQAFGLSPGVDAVVRVPEIPDRTFPGKVTRIADALAPGTRTLLTEIDIPNPDGVLTPGTYCTIELHIPRKTPSLLVPADAIIFNSGGLQVAVVEDGVAHFRKIAVARDFGTEVEVRDGVKAGDRVILNPPVDLVEGSKVQARSEAARPA
jgi:multidrug efflux pump subunit AcrB